MGSAAGITQLHVPDYARGLLGGSHAIDIKRQERSNFITLGEGLIIATGKNAAIHSVSTKPFSILLDEFIDNQDILKFQIISRSSHTPNRVQWCPMSNKPSDGFLGGGPRFNSVGNHPTDAEAEPVIAKPGLQPHQIRIIIATVVVVGLLVAIFVISDKFEATFRPASHHQPVDGPAKPDLSADN
jgi:hypothetical protein